MSHYNRFYDFINDILKSSQHETGFTTLRIFNEKKKNRAVPDFIHWELPGL